MPVRQYPNRRTVTSGRPTSLPATFGSRVTGTRRPSTPKTPQTTNRPTITGWQNYTGKTMGPVGQYSRVPGFGRTFRG